MFQPAMDARIETDYGWLPNLEMSPYRIMCRSKVTQVNEFEPQPPLPHPYNYAPQNKLNTNWNRTRQQSTIVRRRVRVSTISTSYSYSYQINRMNICKFIEGIETTTTNANWGSKSFINLHKQLEKDGQLAESL
jgi:hypothetical protein